MSLSEYPSHSFSAEVADPTLREKCPYLEFFWSVFPAFGLNTEIYGVSLCIQSECEKIRTRETPNTDTFYALQNRMKF